MTELTELSYAVRDRVKPVMQEFGDPLWFEPQIMPAPSWAVFPRDPWADLTKAQGNSSSARWHLTIGVYLSAEDDPGCHLKMYPLVGTRGPIMSLLRDRLIKDDLYGLVGHTIKIGQGRGLKVVHRSRHKILPAYIDFDCTTPS